METDCPLRILIVEDLPSDAELAEHELRKGGLLFTSMRVDTKEGFLSALEKFRPDLIISDYAMPQFDGMQALNLSLAHDPHLPFIIFTGAINEETAVACMKAGAADYIIKNHMTRLPLAVLGAIEKQKLRLEKEITTEELIAIYENAPLIMALMDGERRLHKMNGYTAAYSGRSADAMRLMRCGEALRCLNALASPEGCGFSEQCEQCLIRRSVTETFETGRSYHLVEGSLSYRTDQQDGKMTFLLSTTKLNIKKQPLVLVSILDITGRKQTEEELRASEERFETIFDRGPLGIALIDSMTGHICTANPMFAKVAGRTTDEITNIDWMSLMHPDDVRELLDNIAMMNAGKIDGSRIQIRYLHPDDSIVWINMTIAPLTVEDKLYPQHLCIIEDITERKEAEKQLQDTLESLRKAVGVTVQVMGFAVETRDPYTAGHQIRSADLARAIATEMGLPHDKIDGIRLAGSIHDLGKLSIPAEILSKPTELSKNEFALIKEHACQGYKILKHVESSWPLAEIVYQHHERMDGSGYPRNLKGDDILMEARILAIADVVEAMASHRPYRPALGLNAALEEIENNKGTSYDAVAADACLRLFREKGFHLEGI